MAEKTFSLEELSPEIQNGVINYLLNSDFGDSMEYELRWEEGPDLPHYSEEMAREFFAGNHAKFTVDGTIAYPDWIVCRWKH